VVDPVFELYELLGLNVFVKLKIFLLHVRHDHNSLVGLKKSELINMVMAITVFVTESHVTFCLHF
jgi:hypothetical protein